MEQFKIFIKNWKYKNLTLLGLSLIFFFFLASTSFVYNIVHVIGTFGYFGALITGIFFISTYTVAPATIVLFHLARALNPLEIAFFGGIGAMIGDYLVLKYFKDHLIDELKLLFAGFHKSFFVRTLNSPLFAWLIPIIGVIIIALPFPDEFGLLMIGFSKVKRWQFLIITFLLNTISILIIVSIAKLIS